MSSTLTAIQGFANIVAKHKVEPKSCDGILEALQKVMSVTPSTYHEKHISAFLTNRAKILNTLADDYLKAHLGAKYPLLSSAFWELKRNLQITFDGNRPTITKDETEPIPYESGRTILSVPLFAWIIIGKHTTCNLYKGEIPPTVGSSKVKVEISAEMPGVLGSNLRKDYRNALADGHRLVSELLSKDGLGDVLSENLNNLQPEVGVVWIPTVQSLSVKHQVVLPPEPVRYDPAMFIRLRGHCFVVALWEVDDEMPLEGFMREYTEGSFANVARGNS